MNEKYPLVSVVTPCYNMEGKIHRYLDSLLAQTYKNLEIILVDDGSVDKTAEIIRIYIPKLEELGMSLKYIYQENGGAAKAVKTGLDYVTGKYLIWPDADDILMADSIELRVEFLENNPEYAWVRNNAYVLDDNNMEDRSRLIVKHKNIKRECIYNECIKFKTFYCPGCYMIRWEAFLKVNPQKYIYETYFGQNIQMFLPMAYHYKCGYIDKPLFGYIIYNNSHSRLGGCKTYERAIKYSYGVEETMIATMNFIGVKQKDIRTVKNDFAVRRLRKAYQVGNKEDKQKEYKSINGIRKLNPVIIAIRCFGKNKVVDVLDRLYELFDIFVFQITNRR